MQSWDKRPVEIANLFNPAFCALLLRESIIGYEKVQRDSLPYPLAFLILPIVLHKYTRDSLPRSIRSKLHIWLRNNPEAKVQFSARSSQMVPYTKESIMFGLQMGIFVMDDVGNLKQIKRSLKNIKWDKDSETAYCINKARFVGRWFASAGDVLTIFHMWGIQP